MNWLQRMMQSVPANDGSMLDAMLSGIQRAPIGASRVGQVQPQVTNPAPGGFDPIARDVPPALGITQRRADAIDQMAFDAAMNFATVTPIKPGSWNPIDAAKEIADELQKNGFRVSLETSSANGRSAYMSVFDPTTKTRFVEDIRFSDHGLGPRRGQFTPQVYSADDAQNVIQRALQMRANGQLANSTREGAESAAAAEAARRKARQALVEQDANALSRLAAEAFPEEWARWANRTGSAAKSARAAMRRRVQSLSEKPGE